MPLVAAYYRPDHLDEALSLLAEPNRVPLAGGTIVNADRSRPTVEVVDLQSLGLAGVELHGDRLRLGATTTLAEVAEAAETPDWLRTIAAAEAPSTLRTLATVGGTVAARCWESVLLAAFLACDGIVDLAGPEGVAEIALANVVAEGVPSGSIVTSLSIDVAGSAGEAATARTPADVPIVGAVACIRGGSSFVALTGVATTPVLVEPDDPVAGLAPPDDFRGSSAYRLGLARILTARAVASAEQAELGR